MSKFIMFKIFICLTLTFFFCTASIFPGFSFLQPVHAKQTHLAEPAQDIEFAPLKQTGKEKVQAVIDPYTIQLSDGRVFRLTGIEFPDYSPRENGKFSLLAMKVLTDMLQDRTIVIHQSPDPEQGRINRMGHHLAHLEREDDGLWVQGIMLQLGLARVYTTSFNPHLADRLYAMEKEARDKNLGIWSDPAYKILTPEETHNHLQSVQLVVGKIVSTALKNNRIYLNFGNDWRDDFTVTIAPENRKSFLQDPYSALNWNGREIRVRGWVDEYNGPFIEIDHPEAVEILSTNKSSPLTATAQ